jgi:hypothetical protein
MVNLTSLLSFSPDGKVWDAFPGAGVSRFRFPYLAGCLSHGFPLPQQVAPVLSMGQESGIEENRPGPLSPPFQMKPLPPLIRRCGFFPHFGHLLTGLSLMDCSRSNRCPHDPHSYSYVMSMSFPGRTFVFPPALAKVFVRSDSNNRPGARRDASALPLPRSKWRNTGS